MNKLYALLVVQAARFSQLPELSREEGQTLAEYALILALIAAIVVAVVLTLGHSISSMFSGIASAI